MTSVPWSTAPAVEQPAYVMQARAVALLALALRRSA